MFKVKPDEIYQLAAQSFVGESWNQAEYTTNITGLGALRVFESARQINKNIAESYGCEVLAIETDLDHVHILFKAKPQTDLLKFINNWKSATAKVLRRKFAVKLKNKLWGDSFWSNSYCLITTGQTTLDQVKKYVESQKEKHDNNI